MGAILLKPSYFLVHFFVSVLLVFGTLSSWHIQYNNPLTIIPFIKVHIPQRFSIKINIFTKVLKLPKVFVFRVAYFILSQTDFYFNILGIACTGSKYGDFEGVQGLGVIILLTRLRGVQRRYTGIYERLKMQFDVQTENDEIIFF